MKNLSSHKIFLSLAIIGILILAAISYLSVNALKNGTDAKINSINFYQFHNMLTKGNFLLFVILLFVSNIMYIRQKYWDTFIWTGLIFLAFTIIDWFWLSDMIFHYKKKNNLWQGETNLGYFVGFVFAFLSFGIIIFNYFILKVFVKEKKNKDNLIKESNNEIQSNK